MAVYLGFVPLAFSADATPFKAGDRVAYIGASITHNGTYHRQIQLFYATRYPDLAIDSRNFGIAGDTTSGVLRRFEWDIAPYGPNRATINVGLNGIGYWLYETGRDVAEPQKRACIDRHVANMDDLVRTLTEKGIRPTLITLTPVDETGTQKRAPMVGVNAAIQSFAPRLKEIADRYHAEFIDITGELERLNLEGQRKDPNFTLIGPDRVHPGGVGHLVMAYLILKAQGCGPVVATMAVDAAQGEIRKQENCTITRVSRADGGVSFTCLANALPFPVAKDTQQALELVPFAEDLNQEMLTVSGLAEGEYELLIDGQPAFRGKAVAFAAGIDLATNEQTPQYRQAVQVQGAVTACSELVRDLRFLAMVEHGSAFKDLKEQTTEARIKALEAKIPELETAGDPGAENTIRVYRKYIDLKPKQVELEGKIQPLYDHIYEINQPMAHAYVVRPVPPAE